MTYFIVILEVVNTIVLRMSESAPNSPARSASSRYAGERGVDTVDGEFVSDTSETTIIDGWLKFRDVKKVWLNVCTII